MTVPFDPPSHQGPFLWSSSIDGLRLRLASGFARLWRNAVKPVLRPGYRLARRILSRIRGGSPPPVAVQTPVPEMPATQLPPRPPLAVDPTRCLRPFTAEELTSSARKAARSRLGIPHDQPLVISLGQVAYHKGPLACLSGLEQLRYWNVPAHLYLIGPIQPELRQLIDAWIADLSLAGFVHLLEQPCSDEYRDFLIAADCAIQIQTHLPGTFSGALLDCLSAGLPTVCNEGIAAAMNTPGFVLTVPDQLSPLLVGEKLWELYRVRDTHRGDDTYRLRNVSEHNSTNYSPQILKLLLAS